MGENKTTAFLGIYGKHQHLGPLYWLDILNAETGQLTPDGILDGIVPLYKLKDGKVVEKVSAKDL